MIPFGRSKQRPLHIVTLEEFQTRIPWRISTPLAALARQGHLVRTLQDGESADFSDADLLLLHQPASEKMTQLMTKAGQAGVAVCIDSDDLLLEDALPVDAYFSQRWRPDYFARQAQERVQAGIGSASEIDLAPRNDVLNNFHQCLREADVVTVSTPQLAAAYQHFNSNILVLPNCYDDSNLLWDVQPPPRATINIGFLGTEHHSPNLELLHSALEPVLQNTPWLLLVEAGEGGLIERVDAPPEQLVHLGTQPFETYPMLLHQMDIVLAPLIDSPFMRSKSNIRCLTAGLVGAPVVASPVGPYADYIEHGYNGLFARTTEDWTACIQRLVASPKTRRSLGENNRQQAREYAISRNISRWENAYDSVLHSYDRI